MINHSAHPIQEPLIVYHEDKKANELPCLEIRDQSIINGLDNIIRKLPPELVSYFQTVTD
jgi:hypothetical protein